MSAITDFIWALALIDSSVKITPGFIEVEWARAEARCDALFYPTLKRGVKEVGITAIQLLKVSNTCDLQ